MTTEADVILTARDVHRSFGGVRAVDVDRFEIERGSIVALIGPNGAGKTTFFNLLTGFEKADGGTWTFEGQELAGKHAYAIAQAGMVRTFQSARVFPRLSVTDNVRLGAQHQKGEFLGRAPFAWTWRSQDDALQTRAAELVDWVGLGAKSGDFAGTLSGGQRKLLELARSVMSSPTLLMLDEPMAGVNPALRQALLDKISELPGEGITVLFVEHDMDVVSAVSDRVVCMAEGTIIASGTAGQVAADERVIEAYLGGSSGDLRDHERNVAAEPREDVAVHDETADPVTGSPEDGHRDLHSGDDPAGDDAAGGGGAS